jgi:tRNA-modifying protein YgfZ
MIIHGMNSLSPANTPAAALADAATAMNSVTAAALHQPLHGVAPLTHLGVIRAEGEEAAKFLHNQLTQDFALLGLSEARLAAFCTAKGRMLASFIGFKRSHTEVLLVCSQDLLAPTLKRLSMFVLRAKVKLSDASADFTLAGLVGSVASDLLSSKGTNAHAAWHKVDLPASGANVVSLYPAAGHPRALWIAPATSALPAGPALTSDQWQWTEVQSGVATVNAAVVEAFVPQMLNYESVGGVSFKKGCYPGQEIVARSQFRGTLKRRTFLVHTDSAAHAGQAVFSADDAEQACGTVIQCAPSLAPLGGRDALVSAQVASMANSPRLGAADGPALTVAVLPYVLLDDI